MSTPLQTPARRPRPPAKARRSMTKRSTTPPPAYATATTFPFPTSEIANNDSSTDAIDTASPGIVSSTWGKEIPVAVDETQSDDLSWLNDKSRDELTNLLVQADVLIKERENELNLTSAACKTLYENNVALKTKHESLISRLPVPNTYSSPSPSPSRSHSNLLSSPSMSPLMPRSPLRHSISLNRSASESGVTFSPVGSSPEQMLSKSYNGYRPYKSHQRRPSVSTDISFLADQNAELLNKLEKLESEATSADLSGRRELKRLEREIAIMKEELEKTQLKSSELEEKTNKGFELGAKKVVEQVLKRERRISARRMSREVNSSTFRDFAPQGSGFGLTGSKLSGRTDEGDEEMYEEEDTISHIEQPVAVQPDQLIDKLLEKIQELESTNTKILEQQTETTSRLQAVQRETEFMTKIYERISDAENNVLVDINEEEAESRDRLSDEFGRKNSSQRKLQSQLLAAKVKRQRSFHKNESRIRQSVVNLFDDTQTNISTPPQLPVPFPESGSSRHTSSYSIGSGGLASPALSSLSLNSPPRQQSPLPQGTTLASEIGDEWGGSNTDSVRWNLSEFSSVPSSPTLMLKSFDVEEEVKTETLPTPRSIHPNSLQLSIEPPTPQKYAQISQQEASLIGNMSPRFRMTQSLRSRKTRRQLDSLYLDPFGSEPHYRRKFIEENSPTPANMHNGGLLADAFEVMMEEFDGKNGGGVGGQEFTDYSRSPTPDIERLAYSRENSVDPEEEPYNEDNSLITRSDNKVASSKFGGVMVEVWMWLQFVIIVLVFLWAMAKRGPKSVLKTAERKRTLSMKTRS